MRKTKIWQPISILIGILMIVSVAWTQEQSTKKDKEIKTVRNPRIPRKSLDPPYDSQLTEDLIIGKNEKNADYYFEFIRDIKTDKSENIYVVDEQSHNIKVFSRSGIYLKSIGRQGQGPGEFIAPVAMFIKDKIHVYSFGRISYFTLDGNYISSNKVMFGRVLCFDSQGNIITQQPGPPGKEMNIYLRKFDPEGKSLKELAVLTYANPVSSEMKMPAFPKTMLFAVREDKAIIWGDRDKYELNVLNEDGELFLIIKKQFEPVEFSDKFKIRFLSARSGQEEQYDFPKYLPPIRLIINDDSNNILVCTYEETENKYIYNIFNENGNYQGDIAIDGLPLLIKNEYIYCRGEDENGLHQVIRYRFIK